jgi:hypothetical protein
MATYAEEQAARFAAQKKLDAEQGFFDKMRRKFTTDPVAPAVKAAPPASAPRAPASSTRELLEGRGKQIDAAEKAAMKRGGSVKSKRR